MYTKISQVGGVVFKILILGGLATFNRKQKHFSQG